MTIAFKSALVGSLAVASALAAAQVYDAAADFSTTNNPNGVWSYGNKQTSPTGTFALNSTAGNFFGFGAGWSNGSQRPVVGHLSNNAYGANAGTVYLHSGVPGQEAQIATLRFTAAVTGIYTVTGMFYAGDSGLTDNLVYFNNSTALVSDLAQSGSTSFSFVQSMTAGQVLDFMIAPGGDANSDTTPLDVHIVGQPVPEPATMSIMGLAALGYLRRRRKASK